MAVPLPASSDPDLLPRRIFGLCAALSLFVPLALVAGVLGFGEVASAAGGIARILFFIFLLVSLVTLIAAIV